MRSIICWMQVIMQLACILLYLTLKSYRLFLIMFAKLYEVMESLNCLLREFLLVILKLRINPPLEFLAYQFRILTTTAFSNLMKWLKQMGLRLQDLIIWPERDALRKTMPMCFKRNLERKLWLLTVLIVRRIYQHALLHGPTTCTITQPKFYFELHLREWYHSFQNAGEVK